MKWYLGFSDDRERNPNEWKSVSVPIDVQLAYCNDERKDIHFGANYLNYKWMEEKWWHFKTKVSVEKKAGFIPFLNFKGLDYRYTIYINDKVIIEDEGMFTPVSLNLSEYENSEINVLVLLHPIPKKPGVPEGNKQPSASCIPAVSYGWDWHPRLVPTGIYDDVELSYVPLTNIQDADISYDISDDLKTINAKVTAKVTSPNGIVVFELWDDQGNKVLVKRVPADINLALDFTITNPRLWWCVNQGPQNLYFVKLIIEKDGVSYTAFEKRIGFRKVRLLMNGESWEGSTFPKTQGKAPITLELNGRRIFGKGTNFVPPEIFTSKLNRDIYQEALTLAKDCNMNLLRLWGGGLVNKESFFELCDEMGLMVWQEFPLACNNYENDPHYLAVLDKESKSIIKRLKRHPCVVLWCGGNELFCSWGGMTNQSHALRLLDRNCFDLDRNTPFIHTSPLYGMGHGHYMPLSGLGTECMTDIIHSDFTAYTEFGIPSPSSFGYIKTFTPENELYKVEPGTAWEHHHAIKAWDQLNTWFCIDHIEAYFGKAQTLEETIENGIMVQKECYKHIFEEARRKWPKTSMALNWCFNEPWPTAANNSIVNYPNLPKLSYYGVKDALRNQMLSMRVDKMIWKKGEEMILEIFALNDLPTVLPSVNYSIRLIDSEGKIIKEWNGLSTGSVSGNSVSKEHEVSFVIPDDITERFTLNIICDNSEMSSQYLMVCPK